MSLGRRKSQRQQKLFVPTDQLPQTPRHVFYERLNALLAEHDLDQHLEQLCEPYYAAGKGRPSIPPGVYFRMLLIGYFEGLDSQRGIAWRCADSLSLKAFLGYHILEETPDHSSLSRIRDRLPLSVHEQVFTLVLNLANDHLLLTGLNVGVDSTFIEANAAMKCIVRKDTGEDWKEYLKRLMVEAGQITKEDNPTDEDLRRFDKQRAKDGEKKVSNEEWASPTDPDSQIVKMKDGRTHLGYKVEHVVDLETELILHAGVYQGTDHDTHTLVESVICAQVQLDEAQTDAEIMNVAADKGYYKAEMLTQMQLLELQPYIPEKTSSRKQHGDGHDAARFVNRVLTQTPSGRRLQRQRSEKVERSFAHTCESGGARRSHLRGLDKIRKRYTLQAAARNLGLVMRKLCGAGTPRSLADRWRRFAAVWGLEFGVRTASGMIRVASERFRLLQGCFDRFRNRFARPFWYSVQTAF